MKITAYMHEVSGDIATLSDWRADYRGMGLESWHGKSFENCDPGDWVKDGKIIPVELTTEGECFFTNRVFPGCFQETAEGRQYFSEWACRAKDEDGNQYLIIWQFLLQKGHEPEIDELPWDDESKIDKIEVVS